MSINQINTRKFKLLFFAFLIISTLVLTTNIGMARLLSSKITGEIRADSSSGPLIIGAKVTLLVNDQVIDIQYSGDDGTYMVEYLALVLNPLACVLRVEKEGYDTVYVNAVLPPTPGTNIKNIILESATPPPPPPQNAYISGHLKRIEDGEDLVAVPMQIYKTGAMAGETTTDENGYYEFVVFLYDATSITITASLDDIDDYMEGYSFIVNPGDVISNLDIFSKGWYVDDTYFPALWPIIDMGQYSFSSEYREWCTAITTKFHGIELDGAIDLNQNNEISILSRLEIDHEWYCQKTLGWRHFVSVGFVEAKYELVDPYGNLITMDPLLTVEDISAQTNAADDTENSLEMALMFAKVASTLLTFGFGGAFFDVSAGIITEIGTTVIGQTAINTLWMEYGVDEQENNAYTKLYILPKLFTDHSFYPIEFTSSGEEHGYLSFLNCIEFNFPGGGPEGQYCINIYYRIVYYIFTWEGWIILDIYPWLEFSYQEKIFFEGFK